MKPLTLAGRGGRRLLAFSLSLLVIVSAGLLARCAGLDMTDGAEQTELNEAFISEQDFYWPSLGTDPWTAVILGNGILGASFRQSAPGGAPGGAIGEAPREAHLYMGRVDVKEDRRLLPSRKTSRDTLYDEARLPIGYFAFSLGEGDIDARLSLWNGEAAGSIRGGETITYRAYIHALRDIAVFETSRPLDWRFQAFPAISPRVIANPVTPPADYSANPNPAPYSRAAGGASLHIQPLFSGVFVVTAWRTDPLEGGGARLTAAVTRGLSEEAAVEEALGNLAYSEGQSPQALAAGHRAWWNAFWPRGAFVTFPDTDPKPPREDDLTFTRFYYRCLYKLASAQRPDRAGSDGRRFFLDLQGPWPLEATWWPAAWFNLNIQLTYSPVVTANRPELAQNILDAWWDNRATLAANAAAPGGGADYSDDSIVIGRSATYDLYCPLDPASAATNQYETGNLTWAFYYWAQYCDFTGDDTEAETRLYPLLTRAINYYFHIRYEEGGKYHLPATASPEYGGFMGPDVNYDLALLRWGLVTLLDLHRRFPGAVFTDAVPGSGMAQVQPRPEEWRDFLDKLADYPQDSDRGYRLSALRPFEASHRHYSHLLMFEPLHVVNWDCDLTAAYTANAVRPQGENRETIIKTLNNWQGMSAEFRGYSYTGAAAMYAQMGQGLLAVRTLSRLFDKNIPYSLPAGTNTLYHENQSAVIETPLAALQSLQELYLQSWPGLDDSDNGPRLRVFPAVPEAWQDCRFSGLRASGAFLVSAVREGGRVTSITVKSERGGPVRVQTGMTRVLSAPGGVISDVTIAAEAPSPEGVTEPPQAVKTVKLVTFPRTAAGRSYVITGE